MELAVIGFINRIRTSKLYIRVTAVLFPVLIALMAFIKVNKGLDITDSAYSCTNFTFLDRLDGMWYYSTFYANLLGRVFTYLPNGDTFLGLNIYTGCIKLLLALFAYFFFTYAVKVERFLVFLGVMVSVALCWCPTTILYNYLTYFLFFIGAVFMYGGLVSRDNKLLVIAGFFLGSNFFVRLPNVVEAGLIVALWFYSIIKREKFSVCLQKTLWCILGYIIAFIPGFVLIAVTRGFSEYINGIKELFAMTDESTSYSSVSMIISIIRQYIETSKWTVIVAGLAVVCALIYRFLPKTLWLLKLCLCTALSALTVIVMYKRGLFPLNFHWFEPVYRYGALILSIAIIWFVVTLFVKRISSEDKLLAAISLMIIFITPIGSNNDIYSNLNNLFFVLPTFLYLLVRFCDKKSEKDSKITEALKGVRLSVVLVTGVWFVLSMGFGVTYIFRDGLDGKMDTYVTGNPAMAGMKTTKENAKNLSELSLVWEEHNLADGEVLLYGDVCGLSFYMDTPVAISTAWPSLPSFSIAKFKADMGELEGRIDGNQISAPVVVLDKATVTAILDGNCDEKKEILNEFLDKYGYNVLYSNDVLTVLTVK